MAAGSININWEQFHFLRPGALYLFIPLVLTAVLLILGNKEKKQWKQMIAPVLRPFLFTRGNRRAVIWPLAFFLLGTSLVILGIAGPAWKKITIPGQKVQAVVMIAFDLSSSMLAKDIQPNRLERAKLKISDFLDAGPGAKAGIMAYAGTPHLVLPFTADYALIKLHAGSLGNREMPVQGSNTALLVHAVDTLMQAVLAPGNILLITDVLTPNDAALYENYVNSSIHRLEVLLVSSPNGAAVPGFKDVRSRQDPAVIAGLSRNPKIKITPLTLDTTDVGGIAARVREKLVFEKDEKEDEKNWQDEGYLLIIPALLIAGIWFRKGWVIQWCWLGGMVMLCSCGVNSRDADRWYTRDYQGQVLYNEGKYEEAADRFRDAAHKGAAYFKAGNYEAAAAVFALDTSAAGAFNRGMALSRLGRYEEAMQAFTVAEKLDSSLRQRVAINKHKMQITKTETDSVMRYDKKYDSLLKKTQDKNDPLKERERTAADQKLAVETQVKDLPKSGDRITEDAKSNIHQARESDEPPSPGDDKENTAREADLKNVILRKPPADPGEFLHKRFLLQQKKYYKHVKPGPELW